ncbi:MAG: LLM class flavin-dependent oxidoreductase [Betaproteobacteria bacterium]|nr:LLM class flavin-dependent oxidoreductase [Betaproteobacteria bacterium]MBV9360724.1 LLM class flavin-dependent oxidoreductase [Betaproteobacteria bacterium]
MRLSILDQSPIISGHDARRAIEETLALARRADELGYERYWLAEHHAIAALGDPCPELLAARLGAETKRIRIGTGGVLLPYYSAFRVAEAFRMLEARYPGRVDLGIGRAPGGDARTAHAVAGGGFPDASQFPQQVHELACHLDGTLAADHPFKAVRVQPEVKTAPEIWLLGSSDYSGALAAQLGLPFSFAHFINPRGGDDVTRAYRERFQPGREKAPRAMVCTFLICAETDDEAERLAAPIDLRRLHMALNIDSPIPTDAEAARHRYGREERQYVMGQRARAIIGSPDTCRKALEQMAQRYGVDEVMVLTITGAYETRRRSYELLMAAFQ